MGGALDLDQGEELVHLHAGLLLLGVAQQVGHDGHVVLNVGAQRDGDRLTLAVGHTRRSLGPLKRLGPGLDLTITDGHITRGQDQDLGHQYQDNVPHGDH